MFFMNFHLNFHRAIRSRRIHKCLIPTCRRGKQNQKIALNFIKLIFSLKRCPSWCDRILMTKAAKHLMESDEEVSYCVIGEDVCMGDHKVIFNETIFLTFDFSFSLFFPRSHAAGIIKISNKNKPRYSQ